jgi:hypothetical protein
LARCGFEFPLTVDLDLCQQRSLAAEILSIYDKESTLLDRPWAT